MGSLDGRPGVLISAPLSVREAGFSLHAATRARAADEQEREALLKYILRPPLSTEQLLPEPDGLVRLALKKPFSDGTVAVDLDPLSLLCRLVALVSAPRFHTVRYSDVLAAASKWRPLIVPKPESTARPTQRRPAISSLRPAAGVRGPLPLPPLGGPAQPHLWHRCRTCPRYGGRSASWPSSPTSPAPRASSASSPTVRLRLED